MRRSLLALLAVLVLPTSAGARERFDARVLARVPDPGFVADTALGPDGTIYGATFFSASGNGGDGTPSKVFAWSPDGALEKSWTVQGQDLSQDHGVQAATVDAQGRLYLLDTSPARVIRLDPRTGAQTTWATFPDLKPCGGAQQADCSKTTADNASEPDYAAWGPDGSLYVTDDTQATIFKVPPGGGAARVWLTDPRFDAVAFGLTGLALTPDRSALALTTVGSSPTTTLTPADGSLLEVPIRSDGSPGPLRTVWQSRALDAPDGFAFAASGDVYVALLGPGVDQIAELSPQGKEIARFPAAGAAPGGVPFDSPSSVTFDGDRLIVTNDAYFSADRSHQVLFDVEAGEPGAPVFVPGRPGGTLRVTAARVRLRVGQTSTVRVRVSFAAGTTPLALPAGTRVFLGPRRVAVPPSGAVTVRYRPRRHGVVHLRAGAPGVAKASVALRVARRAR